MNDVITLIQMMEDVNEYGTAVEREADRHDVFCEFKSISMKESYEALSVGHRPEIKAVLADYYDYSGERKCMVGDVMFNIIRAYRNGNRMELTLERM